MFIRKFISILPRQRPFYSLRLYYFSNNTNNTTNINKIFPFEPVFEFSNLTKQLYNRLVILNQEYQKISEELNSDRVMNISSSQQEHLRQRMLELTLPVNLFEKYSITLTNINELQKLLLEAEDKESKEFAKEEITNLESEIKDAQDKVLRYLFGNDKFDTSPNITIEIRPGIL
jgi:protein subunit release factor A